MPLRRCFYSRLFSKHKMLIDEYERIQNLINFKFLAIFELLKQLKYKNSLQNKIYQTLG